jgi:iron complex transport system substrate-binding protein
VKSGVIPALSRNCNADPIGRARSAAPRPRDISSRGKSLRRYGSDYGAGRTSPPLDRFGGRPIPTSHRFTRTGAAAAAVILALTAGACGSTTHTVGAPPTTAATPTTATTPSATTVPATIPATSAYPQTVKTPAGTTVIKARPTRIVSLSPTATEDLFAIGAGPQVVAVDKYSDYPADAPHTQLDALNPNLEAIADYKPDLVVGADEPANLDTQLAKLKIASLDETAAASLDQAYQEILSLGAITDHVRAATTLVASMKAKIATVVAGVHPSSPPITYYYELSPDYYSVTSDTFVGQLLALLGLKDIADARGAAAAGGYPQLSSEFIIGARPDLVFLADTLCCGQTVKTVKARPGWTAIPAVKAGAIVDLNDDIASRWGPRIVTLITEAAAAVKKLQAQG